MAVWSEVKVSRMSPDFRLDAEHYRPEYLDQEKAIAKLRAVPLAQVARVSDGNHVGIAEAFSDEGVRYLRGQDLSDFFISDADPIYIPEKWYRALARSHMHKGDVLVGIVGTIGTVGLVGDRFGKLTGNCKLAILRGTGQIPAEFLAVYLASRLGQNEIARRIRGAVQMGLILPDLEHLPVIVPSEQLSTRVVELVRTAQYQRARAAKALASAENQLMEALGLDHLDLTPQKCYTRSFRELQDGNRFAAEYYMPCKRRVLDALASRPHRVLADHSPSIREMWDPTIARRGERVRNFDVTDALEPFLDDTEPQFASEIGSTKKRLQTGDVVISRLRSYLKEIAVVRTSDSLPTVGSSEFIVLRPKPDYLSAETLMVFLRCPLVQTVLKWSQDGSNHPRFAEEDLLAIPIPNALLGAQQEINDLVSKAIDARRESTRLLNEAKATVEQMIAGDAS